MDKIPVKDEKGLVRDAYSGAILSNDLNLKNKYKEEQKRIANINKIEKMENDINELKNNMHDIKDLLKQILNKNIQGD